MCVAPPTPLKLGRAANGNVTWYVSTNQIMSKHRVPPLIRHTTLLAMFYTQGQTVNAKWILYQTHIRPDKLLYNQCPGLQNEPFCSVRKQLHPSIIWLALYFNSMVHTFTHTHPGGNLEPPINLKMHIFGLGYLEKMQTPHREALGQWDLLYTYTCLHNLR